MFPVKSARTVRCLDISRRLRKISQENEPLTINRPSIYLHSWLRRAASKLTIAYDGSRLKEGVFVYIKSVRIKDIPLQCYLGEDNNVGAEGYGLSKILVGR